MAARHIGLCGRARDLMGLVLALTVGCGGVEPDGPSSASWPTTVQTDSDGCTPATGDSGAVSEDTGCADSSTGECTPGVESCPCLTGGGCDSGLMCISEVCVQMPCPLGTEGCACTQGGACDPDLTCVDDVCS